jgi:putative sigma-54 modulation protein
VEITVSSRHTEVSEALRASTIEKIGRMSRFLEGMDRAEVHFSEHRNKRNADKEVCEVTLEGHGHHVRCKVSAPDGFAAVDRAVEKLEHQLHKLKTKLLKAKRNQNGHRRSADRSRAVADDLLATDGVATAVLDDLDDDELDERTSSPRIVKSKRFTIKPMTPDEAVLQMDLLGHDFFFFTNADTERAAVVYRRSDGDVGLIDEA